MGIFEFVFVSVFVVVVLLLVFFFYIKRSISKASSEYPRAVTLKVNCKTSNILTTSPIKIK